jgi:hypothetical protein
MMEVGILIFGIIIFPILATVAAANGTILEFMALIALGVPVTIGFWQASKISRPKFELIQAKKNFGRKLEDDIAFCFALGDDAYYDAAIISKHAEEYGIELNDTRIDAKMFNYLSDPDLSWYRENANQVYH